MRVNPKKHEGIWEQTVDYYYYAKIEKFMLLSSSSFLYFFCLKYWWYNFWSFFYLKCCILCFVNSFDISNCGEKKQTGLHKSIRYFFWPVVKNSPSRLAWNWTCCFLKFVSNKLCLNILSCVPPIQGVFYTCWGIQCCLLASFNILYKIRTSSESEIWLRFESSTALPGWINLTPLAVPIPRYCLDL